MTDEVRGDEPGRQPVNGGNAPLRANIDTVAGRLAAACAGAALVLAGTWLWLTGALLLSPATPVLFRSVWGAVTGVVVGLAVTCLVWAGAPRCALRVANVAAPLGALAGGLLMSVTRTWPF